MDDLSKTEETGQQSPPQSNDPLHGVTLQAILVELQAHYGWEGLSKKINVNCFKSDPSLSSSLKFLRRTPWARTKVERLFLFYQWKRESSKKSQSETPK